MLVAPRLERLTEPDEEPGDGDDPSPTTDDAIERLSFDDALAELQRTVAELEAGGQPLEERSRCTSAASPSRQRCERLLRDAELRVQQLVARAGGALEAQDVRPDEAREAPDEPAAAG